MAETQSTATALGEHEGLQQFFTYILGEQGLGATPAVAAHRVFEQLHTSIGASSASGR